MKFKKRIILNHHLFLLFDHQKIEYLYKFNTSKTEKKIYLICYNEDIMPSFLMYCSLLFIKYEKDFMTLQDILYYNIPIDSQKIVIQNLIYNLRVLHSKDIAWVDIKPNNILINPKNNKVLFIDFNRSRLKGKNNIIGRTFPFVPPEFVKKQKLQFKDLIMGDIFVLGMIIVMIIGKNRLLLYDGKYIKSHYKDFINNLNYYKNLVNLFFDQQITMLECDRFKRVLPIL